MSIETDANKMIEILKFTLSLITPILVVVYGYLMNKRLKKAEQHYWIQQKVVEKRLEIIDYIAADINTLFCYFTYVGRWKETSPIEIIQLKRSLDQTLHINSYLFSPTVIETYNLFIDSCFETFTGWGNDAKLNTDLEKHKEWYSDKWVQDWDNYFSESIQYKTGKRVYECYYKLIRSLSLDLGINSSRD